MNELYRSPQIAFCENIKNLRIKRKWSQQYLASRLGISAAAVSKIELGGIDVTLSSIQQLAIIYEMPVAELLKAHSETIKEHSQLNALKEKLFVREEELAALHHKVVKLYEEFQHVSTPVI